MQFRSVSVIPQYMNLATTFKDILMSWLCPAFCSWAMNIFLVLSTFPCSQTSLLQTNNPSVFPNNYMLHLYFSSLDNYNLWPEIHIFFTVFTQTLLLCLKLPSSLSQACFWITRQSAECTNRLYLNHFHKTEPFECCMYFWASHASGQCSSLCLGLRNLKLN